MAARSERAEAIARWPISAADSWPERKCTPSTSVSIDVTAWAPARTTAASSPGPRITRPGADSSRAAPARTRCTLSISSRSRIAGVRRWSAVAVDDPRAIEVVRRQLDAYPVTREDPNPKPPHLAGHVAGHDTVHVVELDSEHRVREALDHLALQLDLLFLWHQRARLPG